MYDHFCTKILHKLCGVGYKQGKLHATFNFTGTLPYKQSSVQGKLYDTFYKINKNYCISCISTLLS